jgi:RING-box protein 1
MESKTKPKRVTIKSIKAVAHWKYGYENTCKICTNELTDECMTVCQMYPELNKECDMSRGLCGHAFHFHCVSHWLKQHPHCPSCVDEIIWEFISL